MMAITPIGSPLISLSLRERAGVRVVVEVLWKRLHN
jgi:hypothetical protein